jgi:beta-lactamase superfamily II metal-dependent hydrolase
MEYLRNNRKQVVIVFLVALNIIVFAFLFARTPKQVLTVAYLNVGQGDSILIQSPVGNTMLIDAGSNKLVLQRISEVLPYFDRTIDVAMQSHPDRDHIGGFPDILNRFSVLTFLEPGVESKNSIDDEIDRIIKEKNIPHFLARAGQVIDLGGGAQFKIFYPDKDVSGAETNEASIVGELRYGETCFLFTGDSPAKIEEYLVEVYGAGLKCTVLKAGHHGSKTSSSEIYLNSVRPQYAIISAGKDNSYGHPHSEVTDRLQKAGVKILSTIELGTITMVSDGKNIKVK